MNEFGSTSDNGTIQYPILNFNLTETLAQEIINITTQIHSKAQHLKITKVYAFRLVIENTRTAFMKMLMSGLVLRKMSSVSYDQPFNCEKIYKLLNKKLWSKLTTNDVAPKTPENSDVKYETFNKLARPSQTCIKDVMYENDYIYFLMSAFKSYMNYMRIPDVYKHCYSNKTNQKEDDKLQEDDCIIECVTIKANNNILVDASLVYRYCEDVKWFNEIYKYLEQNPDEACLDLNRYASYVISGA